MKHAPRFLEVAKYGGVTRLIHIDTIVSIEPRNGKTQLWFTNEEMEREGATIDQSYETYVTALYRAGLVVTTAREN